jgi:hypothetical protein
MAQQKEKKRLDLQKDLKGNASDRLKPVVTNKKEH